MALPMQRWRRRRRSRNLPQPLRPDCLSATSPATTSHDLIAGCSPPNVAAWESADPTVGARVIDAYALFVRQEPRSLDDALRFYGVPPGQGTRHAHDARSDVEATVAVLVAQLHTYPDLPRTVDGLHDWLHRREPHWIDAEGKLIWRDGVAAVAFGAQAGTSLADLAANDRGFLEWVLRKDFSDEVKAIVQEALAGRFPVRSETASE